MKRLVLPLALVVIVVASFFFGVFNQSPELMLVWLCLHPFAWFWLGRASVAAIRDSRVAVLSQRETEILAGARGVR